MRSSCKDMLIRNYGEQENLMIRIFLLTDEDYKSEIENLNDIELNELWYKIPSEDRGVLVQEYISNWFYTSVLHVPTNRGDLWLNGTCKYEDEANRNLKILRELYVENASETTLTKNGKKS